MNCPYGYDCLNCPEGEDFDCDYDLSLEEIIASDAMDSDIEAVNPKKSSDKAIAWRKRYYQANKAKIRNYQKEYYQKTKAKRHEYYQKNKERIIAYTKKYQQIHKKEVAELQRKYRSNRNKKENGEVELNDPGK